MTSGSSIQAVFRTAPPQTGQVSMSIPQSRLSHCANVIAMRQIQTSAIGERSSSARLWPRLCENALFVILVAYHG